LNTLIPAAIAGIQHPKKALVEISYCYIAKKCRGSDEFHIHVTWIPAIPARMTAHKTYVDTNGFRAAS
jgi:hypothetical protein